VRSIAILRGLAALGPLAAALPLLVGCSRPLRPEPESHAPGIVEALVAPSDPEVAAAPTASAGEGKTSRVLAPALGKGVAVVELFTSEGCSSCPPADRVLARLTSRAASESLPVYTLSFHVDYWNYLGWRDRFSSSDYSERQRGYASINPRGGTYTPQAVVNGQAECVGSDASQIDSLVTTALQRQSRTGIELTARRAEGAIEVSYRVSGDTAGRVLNLALLEPRAESAVKSGENAGERLAHVNVVRAFTSHALAAGSAGSWSFKPNADFSARRVGVVAYAEDTTQRDISGAAAVELD
jgi:hypothetical protein